MWVSLQLGLSQRRRLWSSLIILRCLSVMSHYFCLSSWVNVSHLICRISGSINLFFDRHLCMLKNNFLKAKISLPLLTVLNSTSTVITLYWPTNSPSQLFSIMYSYVRWISSQLLLWSQITSYHNYTCIQAMCSIYPGSKYCTLIEAVCVSRIKNNLLF